jgi:2-methylaconitate cis-trans-isomerase PrpF
VGPFAIEKGLVWPEEPFTTVKIFNTNSRRMIHAKVPVKRGKVICEGDYEIAGVPGTGAKIELSFMDPGGGVTDKLLPTGNATDEVELETGEKFLVTIVDAGNLTAFVRANDFGLQGTELPDFFDQDAKFRMRLEAIRKKMGDLIGIPTTPSIPKIIFISPSQDFKTITGREINKKEIDLVARAVAMGKIHKAFPVTGGIPAAAASAIPGSIIQQVIEEGKSGSEGKKLIIGHPSGKFDIEVKARQEGDQVHILSCTVGRTARKIMEGRVYVTKKAYQLDHEG